MFFSITVTTESHTYLYNRLRVQMDRFTVAFDDSCSFKDRGLAQNQKTTTIFHLNPVIPSMQMFHCSAFYPSLRIVLGYFASLVRSEKSQTQDNMLRVQ